jgi:hypothetical protein
MRNSALPERVLRLAGWGGRLTCFTAALGTSLAGRDPRWWRPLLEGGPGLAIRHVGDHWLFAHSARPWMPALGLRFQARDDWEEAKAALLAEIDGQGSVIVAADIWGLPWHGGYQRRHAPHWIVLRADEHGHFIEDPLEMMTLEGMQGGQCVDVDLDACEPILRALCPVDPIFELRERSIAGSKPLALQMRYRWLQHVAPEAEEYPAGMIQGAAACDALADHFDAHGSRPEAYAQADDLWQAVRQRELAVAAAEFDPTLMSPGERSHWEAAIERWRRIPPLLMHASLRAQSKDPQPAKLLSAELRRLAEFEGRNPILAGTQCEHIETATPEAVT